MPAPMNLKLVLSAQDKASGTVKRVEGSLTRLGNFVKSRLVITLDSAARAIQGAFRAIDESARLDTQTTALKLNLASQGVALDQFLDKLDEVGKGQVSTAALIQASSKALLLGIPAEEISQLLEIAAVSAAATGTTVGQAFDDIAVGIGRVSPEILDNLGIMLKLEPAYKALADELKISTSELTAAQQKQAILNEVLRVGKDRVEKFEGAQTDLALATGKGRVALQNFTDAAAKAGGGVILASAGVITGFASAYVQLARIVVETTLALERFRRFLAPGISSRFERSLRQTSARLGVMHRELTQTASTLVKASTATLSASLGFDKFGESAERSSRRVAGMAGAADNAATSTAQLGYDVAGVAENMAALAAAAAAGEDAISGLDDASASAAESSRELAGQEFDTQAAVEGLSDSTERHTAAVDRNVESLFRQSAALQVVARDSRNQVEVNAALAAGIEPQGGRIRLPGGGSRLINESSITSGFDSGGVGRFTGQPVGAGTFQATPTRRAVILPDGRIAFI